MKTNFSFFVTPPDSAMAPKLRASTVEHFARKFRMNLAINGNFFQPFHSNSPWDYYPRAGDPVEVLGIAASEGRRYSTQSWANATLYISATNTVHIGGTVDAVWNAISGDQWLVKEGKTVAKPDRFGAYPRAAVALNQRADTLILAAVDGKQPGYSEGVTLFELAEILQSHGTRDAINLDGGGSVTLVYSGKDGETKTLNSPIHTRIPGRQRPVANHLGIRVR